MNYYIAFALAILYLVTPFFRGLFFDSDFYFLHFIVFLLFIVWGITAILKKEKIPVGYFAIFLIPLTYVISFFTAETPNGALDNIFRWFNYAAVLIMSLSLAKDERIKSILSYIFILMGLILSVFVVVGYFGYVDFEDIILMDHEGNKRFTGVFQYGNTFAAVIGAFWLYALVSLTDRNNPIWKNVILAIPMALYSLDFFHTYSRGAWIIFPIAWFIGLVLLPFHRQVLLVIYTLVSTLGGLLIFKYLNDSSPFLVIGIALVTCALIIFITWVDKRTGWRLSKFNSLKFSQFYLTILAIVGAILLFLDIKSQGFIYQQLPTSFQHRVSDINSTTYSLQARSFFFDDAMKISKEHPILGVGGEGWKLLFTQVQEVPYWSNETHNGYLEALLNTGWLGLAIFIMVFGYLFFQLARNLKTDNEVLFTYTRAVIPALLMIFMHSFMDFNFSFGTVWYMVMLLFSIGIVTKITEKKEQSVGVNVGFIIGLILAVSICSIYTLRFYASENIKASIQNGQVTVEQIEKLVNRNPYLVDNRMIAADIYMQLLQQTKQEKYKQQVVEQLDKVEELEPHNASAMYTVGVYYLRLGEFDKGIQYFDRALSYDHYNLDLYRNIMQNKSQLMKQQAKEKQKSLEYANSLLQNYQLMNDWNQKMMANPIQINERNFHIPSSVKWNAGEAMLVQRKYQDVISLVESVRYDQDVKIQTGARALLAAAYQLSGNQAKTQELIQLMKPSDPDFEKQVGAYLLLAQ